MARYWLVLVAALVVAACDTRAPGRRVIEDRCYRSGESETYCSCLAREADRRLNDEMFGLIVMAARGEQDAAEEILALFEPEEQLTYTALLSEITRACARVSAPQS